MLGSMGPGISVQNIYPAALLWALVLNHVDGWKGASLSEPRNSSWVEGVCKHRREQRSPWGAILKAPPPAGGHLDSAPTVSSLLLPWACFILTEAPLCQSHLGHPSALF